MKVTFKSSKEVERLAIPKECQEALKGKTVEATLLNICGATVYKIWCPHCPNYWWISVNSLAIEKVEP